MFTLKHTSELKSYQSTMATNLEYIILYRITYQ